MACPPNGGCRTTSVFDATHHSPTSTDLIPHFGVTRQKITRQFRSLVRTFWNSATNLSPLTSKSLKNYSAASGSPSTGHFCTQPSTNARDGSASAHSFVTSHVARRTALKHRRCGMLTSRPRLLKPRWKTVIARVPTTSSHFIELTARATSSSTPPVPNYSQHVWPSSHTPTTSGTSQSSARQCRRRSMA